MKLKLRIVQGRPENKNMLFPHGEYVFGRGAECHVRPNSDWVSRQHCLLRVTAEGAFLRDLGSRNGTLINGIRLVDEIPLKHGDQVQIGPLVFEVVLEDVTGATTPSVSGTGTETISPKPSAADTTVRALDTAEMEAVKDPPAPTSESSQQSAVSPQPDRAS